MSPILFNIFINYILDTDKDINELFYAENLQIMILDPRNNRGNMKLTAEDLINKLKIGMVIMDYLLSWKKLNLFSLELHI